MGKFLSKIESKFNFGRACKDDSSLLKNDLSKSRNYLQELPLPVFQLIVDYISSRDVIFLMMTSKAMKDKFRHIVKLVKTPISEDAEMLYPIVSCNKNILICTVTTKTWLRSTLSSPDIPIEVFDGVLTELLRRSPFILEHLIIPIKEIQEDHLYLAENLRFFKNVAREIGVHVQFFSTREDTSEIVNLIQKLKPSFLVFSINQYNGAICQLLPCAVNYQRLEFDCYYQPTLHWPFLLQIPYVSELLITDTELKDLLLTWNKLAMKESKLKRHYYKIQNDAVTLKIEDFASLLEDIADEFIGPIDVRTLSLDRNQKHLLNLFHKRYQIKHFKGVLNIDIFYRDPIDEIAIAPYRRRRPMINPMTFRKLVHLGKILEQEDLSVIPLVPSSPPNNPLLSGFTKIKSCLTHIKAAPPANLQNYEPDYPNRKKQASFPIPPSPNDQPIYFLVDGAMPKGFYLQGEEKNIQLVSKIPRGYVVHRSNPIPLYQQLWPECLEETMPYYFFNMKAAAYFPAQRKAFHIILEFIPY